MSFNTSSWNAFPVHLLLSLCQNVSFMVVFFLLLLFKGSTLAQPHGMSPLTVPFKRLFCEGELPKFPHGETIETWSIRDHLGVIGCGTDN